MKLISDHHVHVSVHSGRGGRRKRGRGGGERGSASERASCVLTNTVEGPGVPPELDRHWLAGWVV